MKKQIFKLSDKVVPAQRVTTFNCFLNGSDLYYGSVSATSYGGALQKVADILTEKGYEKVEVEKDLDAVFFWAFVCDGIVYTRLPGSHIQSMQYVSVKKSHTFEV